CRGLSKYDGEESAYGPSSRGPRTARAECTRERRLRYEGMAPTRLPEGASHRAPQRAEAGLQVLAGGLAGVCLRRENWNRNPGSTGSRRSSPEMSTRFFDSATTATSPSPLTGAAEAAGWRSAGDESLRPTLVMTPAPCPRTDVGPAV